MRRFFNLTTVASGIALGMIIAGALALIGGSYARDVVHDQLTPQQIYFPPKGEELPANLNQYAGQQVDTPAEAKAYANDFIGLHLEGIADGKSYAEVSAASMADPDNQELAGQKQSLFMGETLRGLLLGAWGWGTVGTIATIAGFVLIGIGAILLIVPLTTAIAATRRREQPAQGAMPAATA
jgi:predicted lipid-binding transport protein (Tim44 family)